MVSIAFKPRDKADATQAGVFLATLKKLGATGRELNRALGIWDAFGLEDESDLIQIHNFFSMSGDKELLDTSTSPNAPVIGVECWRLWQASLFASFNYTSEPYKDAQSVSTEYTKSMIASRVTEILSELSGSSTTSGIVQIKSPSLDHFDFKQANWPTWKAKTMAKLDAYSLGDVLSTDKTKIFNPVPDKVVKARLLEALNNDKSWFLVDLVGDPEEITAKDIWDWLINAFEHKDLVELELSQLNKRYESIRWMGSGKVDTMHAFFRNYSALVTKILKLKKLSPEYFETEKFTMFSATQKFLQLLENDQKIKHTVMICKESRAKTIRESNLRVDKIDFGPYDLMGCYARVTKAIGDDDPRSFGVDYTSDDTKEEVSKQAPVNKRAVMDWAKKHNMRLVNNQKQDDDKKESDRDDGKDDNKSNENDNKTGRYKRNKRNKRGGGYKKPKEGKDDANSKAQTRRKKIRFDDPNIVPTADQILGTNN